MHKKKESALTEGHMEKPSHLSKTKFSICLRPKNTSGIRETQCHLVPSSEVILLSSGLLRTLQEYRSEGSNWTHIFFRADLLTVPVSNVNFLLPKLIFFRSFFLDTMTIYFPWLWKRIWILLKYSAIHQWILCISTVECNSVSLPLVCWSCENLEVSEATFSIRQLCPLSCPNSLLNGAVCYVGSLVNQDTRH